MSIGRGGGEMVLACGDGSVVGYRAVPLSGRGRAVLVLHDAAGLDEFAREACERLARAGFVAIAPDWAGDRSTGEILGAGAAALQNDHATDGPRIGVLGFGAGGALSLSAEARGATALADRLGAVIDVEGVPPEMREVTDMRAPVLALFGADDPAATDGAVRDLESWLAQSGTRVHVRLAEGAGAGFMDPARADVYAAAAATEAWDAVIAFLAAEL